LTPQLIAVAALAGQTTTPSNGCHRRVRNLTRAPTRSFEIDPDESTAPGLHIQATAGALARHAGTQLAQKFTKRHLAHWPARPARAAGKPFERFFRQRGGHLPTSVRGHSPSDRRGTIPKGGKFARSLQKTLSGGAIIQREILPMFTCLYFGQVARALRPLRRLSTTSPASSSKRTRHSRKELRRRIPRSGIIAPLSPAGQQRTGAAQADSVFCSGTAPVQKTAGQSRSC